MKLFWIFTGIIVVAIIGIICYNKFGKKTEAIDIVVEKRAGGKCYNSNWQIIPCGKQF